MLLHIEPVAINIPLQPPRSLIQTPEAITATLDGLTPGHYTNADLYSRYLSTGHTPPLNRVHFGRELGARNLTRWHLGNRRGWTITPQTATPTAPAP